MQNFDAFDNRETVHPLQSLPWFCYTLLHFGAVAQLGERRVRNAEAWGSIPHSSTI